MKLKINKAGVFTTITFILPILLIYAIRLPEYIGRSVSYLVFFFAIIFDFLWMALDRSFQIISPNAKLNQPRFNKIRPKVEISFRVVLCILAIGIFFLIALPISIDIWDLTHGGNFITIEGKVLDNSTLYGTWFLKQSIHIQGRDGKIYILLFSFEKRINLGEIYEFKTLPRSCCIVEKKLLSNETIKP